MTETTPAPQEQAVGSGQSALDADAIAPEWFIPQSTQDNYAQIARDQAAIRGVEPRAVLQEMAGSFEELHARQPLDGYDHLAAWARSFDPAAGSGPSGLAVLQARVIESARRDPYQAVIGDQAAVSEGVTAQRAYDESVAAAGAAPSIDPASGMLPSAGPLPVPSDVTAGSEGDQQQQAAAAEQRDPGEQLPEGDPAPAPAPAPESAPAPADPPSGGGKAGKTGS
jgi:hypothetical protein